MARACPPGGSLMSGGHPPDACRLRRAGVCLGTREDGYSSCAPCRKARNAAEVSQRADRRKAAQCLTCGARAAKGRRYCRAHLAYYAERDRRRRAG